MKKRIVNNGDKFFKLTIVKELPVQNKHRKFLCMCDCGTEVEVLLCNIKASNTTSCGCAHKEITTKHGQYKSRLYKTWQNMISRCHIKGSTCYDNYGARGIVVCNEWKKDFASFQLWAKDNGYEDNLQIDRIDNNGNYEPNNCRFVSNAENNAVGRKNPSSVNKSGYCGVCFDKTTNKWRAYIEIFKQRKELGYYETKEDAIEVRLFEEYEHCKNLNL